MKPQFTVGVFGIIFNKQKRVLLCHRRDYDLWNLPGGSLEHEESPWDGVRREVKEETGLDVEVTKLVGVYSKPDQHEIAFAFLCTVVGGKAILNDEADRIEYFAIDSLPTSLSPKQAERIKDAMTNNERPMLKVQTGKRSIEFIKKGTSCRR